MSFHWQSHLVFSESPLPFSNWWWWPFSVVCVDRILSEVVLMVTLQNIWLNEDYWINCQIITLMLMVSASCASRFFRWQELLASHLSQILTQQLQNIWHDTKIIEYKIFYLTVQDGLWGLLWSTLLGHIQYYCYHKLCSPAQTRRSHLPPSPEEHSTLDQGPWRPSPHLLCLRRVSPAPSSFYSRLFPPELDTAIHWRILCWQMWKRSGYSPRIYLK